MASCGRNLERALRLRLSLYIGEIRIRIIVRRRLIGATGEQFSPCKVSAYFQQRSPRIYTSTFDQCCLGTIGMRHDERSPGPTGTAHHRQSAADRPQFPGQRQLAGEFILVELFCG